MSTPARVLFLGSGGFAIPILDALAEDPRVQLEAVVTAPPRPVGRRQVLTSSPVGTRAATLGLRVMVPERLREPSVLGDIQRLAPDLIVLADYGRLVPGAILDVPAHGALNLHPSLLPRHRGATPIQTAILDGDAATGVTLMRMDEGLDTGPIVAQASVSLEGNETAGELEDRLAVVAADLLTDTLGDWLAGDLPAMAQPDDGATLTRPLRRADGQIDPTLPAVRLERQVRAYQPWPGAFLDTSQGRVIVRRAVVVPAPAGSPAGTIGVSEADPVLVTLDGGLLLEDVVPAGGRRMTGAELLRGRPNLLGSRVAPGRLR